MDACLRETASEPASAARDAPAPSDTLHWIRWAGVATIAAGLAWRSARYLGQFPIWGDEAMLLLNIFERDYAGLTHHLRFAQVAPLLFLWQEKTALLLFGTAEWSVHLFPFLAGIAAFVIFWRTCCTAFGPIVAGLAVGILAVSYYPVRHACEVKPYAVDLLYSALYAWLALARLRNPQQARWLIALIAATPIAVFSSYTSVFVAGAVSLVLLPQMRFASWAQRGWFGLFNFVLLASFLVHYGLVAHQQIDVQEAQRTREFLRTYWKDAFPPDDLTQWPLWLLKVHTGNMLAYPIGANHGGSTLTFLLVLLGSVMLWRKRQRSLLALCWLPFGLNMMAAILGKYPFGDSARITLHLAPFICILMAHGAARALDWIRAPVWRLRLHLALHVFLLSCGLAGIVRDVLTPFKTEHDRDVRRLARDIASHVEPGEPVFLCHQRDEELLAEFLWYLRAESLPLRWQSAGVDSSVQSYWLVQCSNQSPDAAAARAGWKIARSEARCVPPENAKIPPMYCRWVHIVRD
jgi:hypothetical protein